MLPHSSATCSHLVDDGVPSGYQVFDFAVDER
jgi:hypothetical protein